MYCTEIGMNNPAMYAVTWMNLINVRLKEKPPNKKRMRSKQFHSYKSTKAVNTELLLFEVRVMFTFGRGVNYYESIGALLGC